MESLSQKEILDILNEGFFANLGKSIGRGAVGAVSGGAKALKGVAKAIAPVTTGAIDDLGDYAKGIGKASKKGSKYFNFLQNKDKEYSKLLSREGYKMVPNSIQKSKNGKYYFVKANRIKGVSDKGEDIYDNTVDTFRIDAKDSGKILNLSKRRYLRDRGKKAKSTTPSTPSTPSTPPPLPPTSPSTPTSTPPSPTPPSPSPAPPRPTPPSPTRRRKPLPPTRRS